MPSPGLPFILHTQQMSGQDHLKNLHTQIRDNELQVQFKEQLPTSADSDLPSRSLCAFPSQCPPVAIGPGSAPGRLRAQEDSVFSYFTSECPKEGMTGSPGPHLTFQHHYS